MQPSVGAACQYSSAVVRRETIFCTWLIAHEVHLSLKPVDWPFSALGCIVELFSAALILHAANDNLRYISVPTSGRYFATNFLPGVKGFF